MRILIIRTWPSYLDVLKSSYNIQELGLAKALVKRGQSVDVLLWTDGEEHDVTLQTEGGSINVFYRKGFSALKCVWYPHFDTLAKQYDVLHVGEYHPLFSWHLAGKYPQKTVIYHGPYYSPYNHNYNLLCSVFDLFFVGRYRKLKTPFLTKSKLAKTFLESKGIAPVCVREVGVGIDLALLENESESSSTELLEKMCAQKSGLKLLYIGRIEPRRAPLFLLDVLKAVRREDENACLYIVGAGEKDYVETVRITIHEKGLEKCVCWQEKALQSQLKGLYRQADFFLLPTEFDIFGMVLLEAMYFGACVATTPNGGADMLLKNGENGIVLPKTDANEWARQIIALMRDPVRKADFEQKAHLTVEQEYTWDALAGKFLDAYRQVGLSRGTHNI